MTRERGNDRNLGIDNGGRMDDIRGAENKGERYIPLVK
jgi:hypothetical protein